MEEIEEPARSSQVTTEQVYQAAAELRGLDTWEVIPFAHFRRGLRHVVIAWPAVNSSGEVVDATVVGACLEESADGSNLEQCGQRWVVRDRSDAAAALEEALGGSDYEVVSVQSSATLSQLGPQLERLGNEFVSAIDDDNFSEARRKAQAFAAMLPAEEIAFDNSLAQLLWMAARYNGRIEHVSTENHGSTATLTFDVSRGFMRVRTIQVIAQQTNSGQWIAVEYR